jgi:pyrroloquinoline quinone (PQQ) biosynthesis protein C
MEPTTLEGYKELVKDLNKKIKKTEQKNYELALRYTDKSKMTDKEMKAYLIEQSAHMNRMVTKIQARYRGFHQRLIFRQELKNIASSNVRTPMKINTNETALMEILKAVQKIGMFLSFFEIRS